ncbi:MAG TPA: VanZ family protein [Rhizomicrobium sp.]|nr:VanZ family protein [Rhizomicrobium sp.]
MTRDKLIRWATVAALYLLWPAIAVVVWGELTPSPGQIEMLVWDKALHFIAYFGLGGMVCVALKGERRVLMGVVGLAVLGGVLEVLQGFTGRDPDIYDEAANILGAFSGAGAGWLLLRVLRPKILVAVKRD